MVPTKSCKKYPKVVFWAPGIKVGGQMGVKTANSPKTDYSRLKICIDTFFHTRNSMVAFIFTSCEILTLFGAPTGVKRGSKGSKIAHLAKNSD